jgi:hypothetical protein
MLYAAAPAWVNGLDTCAARCHCLKTIQHKQALTKNKAPHAFQRAVQHHTAFLKLGRQKSDKL